MSEVSSKKPVRILLLEDNDFDRDWMVRTIKADGLACDFIHAAGRVGFEKAVGEGPFDLIISDFSLPGYDGMTALAVARRAHPETPFIFVSGTIREDWAIESLKNGATDYVLKDRRDRLVAAVRRALRDAQERAERKQLELQLRQAQKMEAIGQLAGGVAHDFNNLLAVIQGNAELALLHADRGGDEVRENLSQILKASERAGELTRQLLALGRKKVVHLHPADLPQVVRNVARMLGRLIGAAIRLRCEMAAAPLMVEADVGLIEQVILNLVVNARDAMPHGGELVIVTRKVLIGAAEAKLIPDARSGDFVCLSVQDTGCGIAPEHLPRIFEPFFTTKEVGKGTGLGLATVYGIVKQHNGWIQTTSQLGVGTTFKIFLPEVKVGAFHTTTPATAQPRRGGTERLLVVEDEPAVRLFVMRILNVFGYELTEAASGEEALEMLQEKSARFDLVLTDLVMPGKVNGLQLVQEARRIDPRLRVGLMSGYGGELAVKFLDTVKGELAFVLNKPFTANDLLQRVRDCLDAKAQGSNQS